MKRDRDRARALAREAHARGRPLEWFEELYGEARSSASGVPWADLVANPELAAWSEREQLAGQGARALVVGCGAGDDAEYLASRGYSVTAFDISPSAVAWCRERFPASRVEYVAADLLDTSPALGAALGATRSSAFAFVFEAFTLQVLPPELQPAAMASMASFVAPGGRLLAIARGRDESKPRGELPWPLTPGELSEFERHGLDLVRAEDFLDTEEPPVRRLRFEFQRRGPEQAAPPLAAL